MPGFMDILQAMAQASQQGGGGGQMPMGVQQIRPGQGVQPSALDQMFAQLMAGQGQQGGGGNPLAALMGQMGGGQQMQAARPESYQQPVQSQPAYQPAPAQPAAPVPQFQSPGAHNFGGGFNFEGGRVGGGAEMIKSKMGFYQSPGKKKALFIGINYFGSQAQLAGCLNDVKNIHGWVMQNYDFDPKNVLVLTDDNQDPRMVPTRKNMTAAMRWLVKDAQRGDCLFFHYSGHGGSTQDTSGDEADGNDETIIPVDYQTAGQISDDEIWEIMVKNLPEGCHLTCIFDSCHSGSVMDLPYTYAADGRLDIVQFDNRLPGAREMLRTGALDRANPGDSIAQIFGGSGAFAGGGPGPNASSMSLTPDQIQALVAKRASNGTVIQFAGCADKQTSADASIGGQKTGAASWAFMQVMTKYKTPTYIQMLAEMRQLLSQKYQQVMQMSASTQLNMDQPFTL